MNNLAPVVLFVYNRPEHTKKTLEALANNELANKTKLYVFSDGPKNSDNELIAKIEEVRSIVRMKNWCNEVNLYSSVSNMGLAQSIIKGVTEVINQHGKVIVLEDDLITSPGFLNYMNDALNFYQNTKKVMSISAYMFPHKEQLPETFLYNAPYPWGWATWKDSWKNFVDDAHGLYQKADDEKKWDAFNAFGGKMLQKQLKANVDGSLKTWYIKWHASVFFKNGLSLYPGQSLVNNIGLDNTGAHCASVSNFDIDKLAESVEIKDIPLNTNKKARKIIIKFYQGKNYWFKRIVFKYTPGFIKLILKKFV
ncbi:MAG: hypothetical protein MI892_25400 [Desulfobacterales bacterium]|nr:hypothetical protein [Desulfobacterales bacterium]